MHITSYHLARASLALSLAKQFTSLAQMRQQRIGQADARVDEFYRAADYHHSLATEANAQAALHPDVTCYVE